MLLLSSWVASPPGGWSAEGWIVYSVREKASLRQIPCSASLCVTAWINQSGSFRTPSPQATSNVHMEPLSLPCPSFPSQGCAQLLPPWPWNCWLQSHPSHQTIHSYPSCSPKLRYFPWGLLSDCQFFQAEAMPALHFLFFPHTPTQALSVGSFLS